MLRWQTFKHETRLAGSLRSARSRAGHEMRVLALSTCKLALTSNLGPFVTHISLLTSSLWSAAQCVILGSFGNIPDSTLVCEYPPDPLPPTADRSTTATMDSADAIPESVWNAVDQVARVPKWMWAAGAVAGLFGITVLVFPFSVIS